MNIGLKLCNYNAIKISLTHSICLHPDVFGITWWFYELQTLPRRHLDANKLVMCSCQFLPSNVLIFQLVVGTNDGRYSYIWVMCQCYRTSNSVLPFVKWSFVRAVPHLKIHVYIIDWLSYRISQLKNWKSDGTYDFILWKRLSSWIGKTWTLIFFVQVEIFGFAIRSSCYSCCFWL